MWIVLFMQNQYFNRNLPKSDPLDALKHRRLFIRWTSRRLASIFENHRPMRIIIEQSLHDALFLYRAFFPNKVVECINDAHKVLKNT